jgi:predicted hydrocarbon binding protein
MVKLVYDPINLENIPIDDYLDNDTNNIVIILNNKAYGVNKALFMFNNEMKRCIIGNKALLKKKTYDNHETFYNIGYFIGKKVIVNQNTLNDVLKEHRIVELTSKTTGDTYVNKEFLELTTIGLIKPSSKNQ